MEDFIVNIQNMANAAAQLEEAMVRPLLVINKDGHDMVTTRRRRLIYDVLALSAKIQSVTSHFLDYELDLINSQNINKPFAMDIDLDIELNKLFD